MRPWECAQSKPTCLCVTFRLIPSLSAWRVSRAVCRGCVWRRVCLSVCMCSIAPMQTCYLVSGFSLLVSRKRGAIQVAIPRCTSPQSVLMLAVGNKRLGKKEEIWINFFFLKKAGVFLYFPPLKVPYYTCFHVFIFHFRLEQKNTIDCPKKPIDLHKTAHLTICLQPSAKTLSLSLKLMLCWTTC